MPRSVAAATLLGYRNKYIANLDGDRPALGALRGALALLSEQLPAMGDGARRASALLVEQLLKALDTSQGGEERAPRRWSRWELRERALRYIDENLGDPKLTPAVIAAAHAVSIRTLYAVMILPAERSPTPSARS